MNARDHHAAICILALLFAHQFQKSYFVSAYNGYKIVAIDVKIHVGKNRHDISHKKCAAHIPRPSSGPVTKGPRITFALDDMV